MIVVLPFASAEAIRKLEAIERVSVVTKGRIEFFGDLDGTKCGEIMRMHGLRGAMLYKATAVFQHKISDYVSFYPHLLLGSLDGKTYLLPDAKNKTLLTDCAGPGRPLLSGPSFFPVLPQFRRVQVSGVVHARHRVLVESEQARIGHCLVIGLGFLGRCCCSASR
jgi:hypothetical protein